MIRRFLPIAFGRFSPRQAAEFGQMLVNGVGYIALGPVCLIFNLPRSLQKADPVPSVFDINAHLREVYQAQGKPAPAWLPAPED